MNDGNNICHSKIHQMAKHQPQKHRTTTSATNTNKVDKQHLPTAIQAQHLPGGCNIYHIKTMAITSVKTRQQHLPKVRQRTTAYSKQPKET